MKKIAQDEYSKFVKNLKIYKTVAEILESKVKSIVLGNNLGTGHNAIQYQRTRIKSFESILDKLEKNGLKFSVENIEENIKDLIGHRIICLNQNDVNDLITLFKKSRSLKIVTEKDYISNPKESGYRSYHIIVKNNVKLGEEEKEYYSEIQIRTLLQDVWSTFEHEIVYKNKNCSLDVRKKLKDLSSVINFSESEINDIKNAELPMDCNTFATNRLSRKIGKDEYKNFISNLKIYSVAEEILKSCINLITLDYSLTNDINDIQKQTSRIKSFDSVYRKIENKKVDFNFDNINENILDLIGYRIVCLNKKDLEKIVSLINSSPYFEVIREKDYVTNPKSSGYRGYHINVLVGVPLSTGIIKIPAEIQVRTLLQDTWATYEEEIAYHNDACSINSKERLKYLSQNFDRIENAISEIQEKELKSGKKLVLK